MLDIQFYKSFCDYGNVVSVFLKKVGEGSLPSVKISHFVGIEPMEMTLFAG